MASPRTVNLNRRESGWRWEERLSLKMRRELVERLLRSRQSLM